ncbi:type II toxin-antitoxin system VapB family antitoxin [Aerophototrophica crusticola]|uniref:Type II toxin-antitoxin system VapB family antitoxin n=1 Tax=Aerophototrophica crusticola TaxID=1709002 RepID=A0A858R725_9PROT|nr:type II toxin-antitoxin system VapB family antitoxin [Rhodospirillaceae bacterium B3]
MGLVIKDKALEEAAVELASLTGENWEDAVRKVVLDKVERERERRRSAEERAAALMDLGRRFAALPDRDRRSADEILGYDEFGLPR